MTSHDDRKCDSQCDRKCDSGSDRTYERTNELTEKPSQIAIESLSGTCAGGAEHFDNAALSPAARQALLLARANLAQARANVCSHGVQPRHCHEPHDTAQDKHDEPAEENA